MVRQLFQSAPQRKPDSAPCLDAWWCMTMEMGFRKITSLRDLKSFMGTHLCRKGGSEVRPMAELMCFLHRGGGNAARGIKQARTLDEKNQESYIT